MPLPPSRLRAHLGEAATHLVIPMRTLEPTVETAADAAKRSHWFTHEVLPHGSALRSWLRARFPWLGDVDDLVQEACVRLWRRQNEGEAAPIRSGRAALFAIARNVALDQARRRSVVRFEPMASECLALVDETDTAEAVSRRQEVEILSKALESLPPRCREIVVLTKLHGLTEREVADRLGISPHTVRAQVVRGIQRCVDYLREHGMEGASKR